MLQSAEDVCRHRPLVHLEEYALGIEAEHSRIMVVKQTYMAADGGFHQFFVNRSNMVSHSTEKNPFCFSYIVGTTVTLH